MTRTRFALAVGAVTAALSVVAVAATGVAIAVASRRPKPVARTVWIDFGDDDLYEILGDAPESDPAPAEDGTDRPEASPAPADQQEPARCGAPTAANGTCQRRVRYGHCKAHRTA